MPPRNIPKEFLVEMHPKNKEWFEEYKHWGETKPNYHKAIERFLKFYSNAKPFNALTDFDLKKYRDEMEPYIGRGNLINAALGNFKYFLITEKGAGDNFLMGLSKPRKAIPPKKLDKKDSEAIALNLAQIGYIRKYNKDQGDINDQYIFEIFFQLGIEKNELKFCYPSKRDKNGKKRFVVDGNKSVYIPYNEKIAELIEKVQDNEALRLKFHDVDKYLKKVTDYLRHPEPTDPILCLYSRKRQIRKNDLKASHDAHFIKCPNCKRSFENAKKNWILAKVEGDEEFYIVCSQCKGELPNKVISNEN